MSFTHLHCHSHYSLLDGLSKIEPLVEATKKLGMESLALTDHGVLYGAIEFYNTCKEAEVKPIIGLEAYISPRGMEDKEGKQDADYFHLTLLCQNDEGYHNLLKLCSEANTRGFYYKPRVDKETLKKYSNGLIALSGCMRGEVARAVVNKTQSEAQNTLDRYLDIFGHERFFIELQRNARGGEDQSKESRLNERLFDIAKKNNLKIAATADCHYIHQEDAEAQDIMVCIGTGRTVKDEKRLDMRGHDLSLQSPEAMAEKFKDLPEAVATTQEIGSMCNVEIPINQRYFANVPIPEAETYETYLRKVTHEKAIPLYGKDGAVPQDIITRIDYELDIICNKGFAPYFLMVADIVSGAHSVGAITNTRGSAAGSIVGKILKITNADPLHFALPFERFLTMHRPTPPDIDLDISDVKRDAAIKWITDRYGKEKVGQIITFGTMMARAAVRDVGRALGIPYGKCDRIAKMIPIGKQGFHMTLDKALDMNPELKDVYERDPETKQILDIARKLEGCCRHASIHAAGIVITPNAMTDIIPIQKEPDGDRIITQYDMYSLDSNADSKAIGAIKLDLLGIRNLSILEDAVARVEARHNTKIDLANLPHPDPKTLKLLADGHTFGVFQLGSAGMTRYLQELKPGSIFDIMAMIALYRPGPLQFIPEYIKRKHNPKMITYLDSALERILHRTYGVLVYQDDLLTIAHDLAGYSWEEVDKFRKAVGKKDPEVMAKQKEKFVDGCVQTAGWSRAKAEEIWAWIEPFAAYGFNKSHSASYSVVSYQTAYLKANYTVEFMAAVMSAESGNEDKIYAAVEECKAMGITVLPPDVNESLDDFTVVDETTIRFGLNAIKNLGGDVILKIKDERMKAGQFKDLEDFLTRVYIRNLNKKSWEALSKTGALSSFGERGQLLANGEYILDYLRDHFKVAAQDSLFGNFQVFKLRLKETPPATKEEIYTWEKELLGMYVTAHPLDNYQHVLKSYSKIRGLKESEYNGEVTVCGIITKMKKMLTKKNDPMAFATLDDGSGSLELIIFPKTMQKVSEFLAIDKIVQVSGKFSSGESDRPVEFNEDGEEVRGATEIKIIVDEMKDLPNDDLYFMALSEMEKNKQIVIHLNSAHNPNALEKIKEIVTTSPGNAQVFLSIGSGGAAKKIKTQTQVRITDELLTSLTSIPEVSMVSES